MKNINFKELFLFVGFISITLLLLLYWLRPDWKIYGDGFNYYSWLRSSWFDHDLNFKNESDFYKLTFNAQQDSFYIHPTITDRFPNPFPIGSSILWLPVMFLAWFFSKLLNLPDTPLPGYGLQYQLSLNLGSIFYGILGLLFLYYFLVDILGNSLKKKEIAAINIITWLSSPLIYFMTYEPLMSHAMAFFVNSLFIFYWYKNLNNNNFKKWITIGLLLGLVSIVRWQDIIIGLVVIIDVIKYLDKNKILKQIEYILCLGLGFLSLFAIQILGWKIIYGKYILQPPSNTHLSVFKPDFFNFLFNPSHGMIIWHPIFIIGIAGLLIHVFLLRYGHEDKNLIVLCLLILLLSFYINSTLSDWYGGTNGSFGARREISILPILTYGVALFYLFARNSLKYALMLGLTILAFWNIMLLPQAGKGWLTKFSNYSGQESLQLIPMGQILYNDKKIILEQLLRFKLKWN